MDNGNNLDKIYYLEKTHSNIYEILVRATDKVAEEIIYERDRINERMRAESKISEIRINEMISVESIITEIKEKEIKEEISEIKKEEIKEDIEEIKKILNSVAEIRRKKVEILLTALLELKELKDELSNIKKEAGII